MLFMVQFRVHLDENLKSPSWARSHLVEKYALCFLLLYVTNYSYIDLLRNIFLIHPHRQCREHVAKSWDDGIQKGSIISEWREDEHHHEVGCHDDTEFSLSRGFPGFFFFDTSVSKFESFDFFFEMFEHFFHKILIFRNYLLYSLYKFDVFEPFLISETLQSLSVVPRIVAHRNSILGVIRPMRAGLERWSELQAIHKRNNSEWKKACFLFGKGAYQK